MAALCGGSYISQRWLDLAYPEPIDDRSGADIAADVIARAGLKMKKDAPNGGASL